MVTVFDLLQQKLQSIDYELRYAEKHRGVVTMNVLTAIQRARAMLREICELEEKK